MTIILSTYQITSSITPPVHAAWYITKCTDLKSLTVTVNLVCCKSHVKVIPNKRTDALAKALIYHRELMLYIIYAVKVVLQLKKYVPRENGNVDGKRL